MTTIFLSHSSKDKAEAHRLKKWLEADERGHWVFLDDDLHTGVKSGEDWEKALYEQLRGCRVFLPLFTQNWVDSKWCFAEMTHARANGKLILPVKLNPAFDTSSLFSDVQQTPIDLSEVNQIGYQRLERAMQEEFPWKDPKRSPFPGLLAFKEDEAAIYKGRGPEITSSIEVLEGLRRQGPSSPHFVLLLGASGCGKSSLVRAGIIPRLKLRGDWLFLPPFMPRTNPICELAEALSRGLKDAGSEYSFTTIEKALSEAAKASPPDGKVLLSLVRELRIESRSHSDATLLLVIDQAEELFSISGKQQADMFLGMLRAAIEQSDGRIMVLATIRSEFFGIFQAQPFLIDPYYPRPLAYENIPLDPLPNERFREIICGPADLVGLEIDKDLVECMITETGTSDALPLLAYTLRRMWDNEYYREDGRFELREYQELGKLEGSISKAADEALDAEHRSSEELKVLHEAFVPKIVGLTPEGAPVRLRVRCNMLPVGAYEALKPFVDNRLLITDYDSDRKETIEIAHEALLRVWPQLVEWIEDDRDFLLWHSRFRYDLDRWQNTDSSDHGALLRGLPLAEGEHWLQEKREKLEAEERRFLKASLKAEERRRMASMSRELAARALLQREDDQTNALLLAIEAVERSDTAEAQHALRETLRFSRCRVFLLGASPVTDIEYSKDGNWLATGHANGALTIWRTQDYSMERRIAGSKQGIQIRRVAFDSEGKYLAAGYRDGKVRIWHTHSWIPGPELDTWNGVVDIQFSPNSKQLLAAHGATAQVWDAETGNELARWNGAVIRGAYFSADGCKVIGNFDDSHVVEVWDIKEDRSIFSASTPAPVYNSVIDPSGQWLVTAGSSGAFLFGLEEGPHSKGILIGSRRTGARHVALVGASSDVAVGSEDGTVRIWKVFEHAYPKAGKSKWELEELAILQGHEGPVNHIAWNKISNILATSGEDGTLRLWYRRVGGLISEDTWHAYAILRKHTEKVLKSVISPHDWKLVSFDYSGKARVWDTDIEHELPVIYGPQTFEIFKGPKNQPSRSVAISRDGTRALTLATLKAARLWELPTGRLIAMLGIIKHDSENQLFCREVPVATDAAFSPDSRCIVTAHDDGTARVWDAKTGTEMRILKGHLERLLTVKFAVEGQTVVSTSTDGTARIWDASTGQEMHCLGPSKNSLLSAFFSPNGKRVITAHEDRSVCIWDVDDGLKIKNIGGPEQFAMDPAVSKTRDGLVTFGSPVGMLQVWDLDTGHLKNTYKVNVDSSSIYSSWTSRGRYFIAADGKGGVRIWDTELSEIPVHLVGHRMRVTCIAVSPDGAMILTGSEDTTTRLWNLRDGRLITVYRGHREKVLITDFSPDGRYMITAGEDGTTLIYHARMDDMLEFAKRYCKVVGIKQRKHT